MRTVTGFGALIAAVVVLAPLTGVAKGQGQERGGEHARERAQVERTHSDFDRDRMHDRDQTRQHSQDRDQTRDRVHDSANAMPDDRPIYGQQMMSVEERNQYREQLRVLGADTEEGTRFQAQHREQMQVRAKEQGVNLEDTPETE
jgi:Tfp pilus assembly protein PilV